MPDTVVHVVTSLPFTVVDLNPDGSPMGNPWNSVADVILQRGVKPETIRTPKGKWRPPTPYHREVHRGQLLGPTIRYRGYRNYVPWWGAPPYRHDGGTYTGAFNVYNSYEVTNRPAFPSDLEGRAVNDALLSLKDQKINLGVAFGERKETAEFVTGVATKAAEVMRAVRKKDPREIKRLLLGQQKRQRHYRTTIHEVLDAPSSLWLQNSYAVKPLIADAYGAVEALNEKESDDPNRFGVIGKSMKMEKFEGMHGRSAVCRSVYLPVVAHQRGFHGCMVRLDYVIENPFMRSLSQLGVTNPLSIAWELVPFSFVADWFLPVGDYLDAQDATLGLTFVGGSVSRLTRRYTRWSPHPHEKPLAGGESYVADPEFFQATGSGYSVWMDRGVYYKSPRPVFPSFEKPFSFPRVTSAIALITQLTSRKGR